MIPKPIDEIGEADIAALVDGGREEGAQLDYKSAPPEPGNEKWKTDFCKDVCAFANSAGGDLVFGVEEARGTAARVVPFETDADTMALTLQNIVLDRIEPQIHGVRIHPVPTAAGQYLLVVRVPRSFVGIHRVKANKEFYVRESRSNRALDVPGIVSRVSDLLGRKDRVSAFFERRYADILAGQYPIELAAGPRLVLHAVPSRSFLDGEEVDLERIQPHAVPSLLQGASMSSDRRVFEGRIFSASASGTEPAAISTLLMHSGVVEATGPLLMPWGATDDGFIALDLLEMSVLHFVGAFVSTGLVGATCGFPFLLRLCILGANGRPANSGAQMVEVFHRGNPVRQVSSALVLPEVLIEGPSQDIVHSLQPTFLRAWHAWGYSKSPYYVQDPATANRWVRKERR